MSIYAKFNDQSFNDMLTNDIVSFEQPSPFTLTHTSSEATTHFSCVFFIKFLYFSKCYVLKKKLTTFTLSTLQPLYNMVRYSTVLDITRFNDGSQKYKDYIEKWP